MSRFDTLLVANRGEIACRVIRTARAMGLTTVAVYSEADADALHVQLADRAVPIGASAARESYLRIDRIVEACRASGAQAVHPGYGFLSESAAFSLACREAGLVFVGPPPEAIDALGNKSAAKRLAERIGVPCLAGYSGADQSVEALAAHARRIGAPLMIKAAAGGGGRGMRRWDGQVDDPENPDHDATLRALLQAAHDEAAASFGNGELLLERLVEHARHVEIQVFGDTHGNYVHLGERDCSTQRRNQKILEEAPAPGVSAELRQAMGDAAIRLAREVGYVGAGTVEFLLAPDHQFTFLEMNTRLQVEHPVTEAVTGLDLVEWQLRVAQGEPLPLRQSDIQIRGHAIEARLCAEDAFAGYVPQSGALLAWRMPEGDGLRVDHGLAADAVIPPHYDSMIAKVIAFGADRDDARRRLVGGLRRTLALGIVTNRDYLLRCLEAEPFARAQLSTRWLGEASGDWHAPEPDSRWLATAAALLVERAGRSHGRLAGFASNGARNFPLLLSVQGKEHTLRVTQHDGTACTVGGDGWSHAVRVDDARGAKRSVSVDGTHVTVHAALGGGPGALSERGPSLGEAEGWVDAFGVAAAVGDNTHAPPRADRRGGSGRVTSSMHGAVVRLAVQPGQTVKRGDLLMAIEAMKMEHRIEAAIDGTVAEVGVAQGQQVAPGRLLVSIEPAPQAGASAAQ